MKRCIKCFKDKNPTDFSPSKQRKDGRYPYCRPCEAGRKAKFRNNNPTVNINAVHVAKYGHNRDARAAIIASQDNLCARCATPLVKGFIDGDHNHFCCDRPYGCGSCFNAYVCSRCNATLTKAWILANPTDPYVLKYYGVVKHS